MDELFAERTNGNLRPLRIVLVDRSIPVRARIRNLIQESKAAQILAETGSASKALTLVKKHRPDAVIMDLSLKDGDGTSLLIKIKRVLRSCSVIVWTNFSTPEFRQFYLKLGADYFLDKFREFERVPKVLDDLSSTSKKRP